MRTRAISAAGILFAALLVLGCSDDSVTPDIIEPFGTIQDRVNAASVGDTVLIPPGVYSDLHEYTDFIGREILVACVVKPGVVVRGATGDPADVVIDGKGIGRGFWFFEAGDSTGLAAVTVRNALWAVSGFDASPWIDNCIMEENGDLEDYPVTAGVGMYFDRSSSVVTNCIFRNNESAGGSGAAFSTSSNFRLEGCVFSGNYSSWNGGGLSVTGGSCGTLVNCSFVGNSAEELGGGIFSWGADNLLVLVGGTISGNTAEWSGGGCYLNGGGDVFEGVVVLDNSASEGPQGYVGMYSGGANLICCDTDEDGWTGPVTVDDSDCGKLGSR